MMAFKPIDPKRDEFRRYLERGGVIEALTKAFVRLIKDKPEDPIEYLRHNLGDAVEQKDNMAYLQIELSEASSEIQRLRDIIKNIDPAALEEPQETLVVPNPNDCGENGGHRSKTDFTEEAIDLAKIATSMVSPNTDAGNKGSYVNQQDNSQLEDTKPSEQLQQINPNAE